MSKENLKLWESVEKTDPKHTKQANVKGNKLTSIKPQYQIYNATKQWGSYGSTWGFKDINLGYELKECGLVTFKALFYYPSGEFEILNTISFWRDNAQTKIDDEFAKKVETDSLTKALSKLGFNADVFMGRFDDLRYIEQVKKEFTVKPKASKQNIEALKKSMNKENYSIQFSKASKHYDLTQDQINELEMYKDLISE
jgi:hypothetical protein